MAARKKHRIVCRSKKTGRIVSCKRSRAGKKAARKVRRKRK